MVEKGVDKIHKTRKSRFVPVSGYWALFFTFFRNPGVGFGVGLGVGLGVGFGGRFSGSEIAIRQLLHDIKAVKCRG
jgi:hypothetical protein